MLFLYILWCMLMPHRYGGTFTQFKYTFKSMGIDARFIDGSK